MVAVIVAAQLACVGGSGTRTPTPTEPPPTAVVDELVAPAGDDFEAGAIGELPVGWTVDGAAEVAFMISDADEGGAGKVLEARSTVDVVGRLRRAFDARPYRGRRVAVEARARATPRSWWRAVRLGVEVLRPGRPPWLDEATSPPIAVDEWRRYEAVVDVAADATALSVRISLVGPATLRLDDLQLIDLGPAGGDDAPPAPLVGRALDNVTAFARLYGLVRYFHPSDEAAALDVAAWERFVVRGVRAVEPAVDAAALAATLGELFAPLAPTLEVYLDGAEPASVAPVALANGRRVRWRHEGLGISKNSTYRSVRAGTQPPATTFATPVDAATVRGKTIRVRAGMRATLEPGEDVGLYAYAAGADGALGFFTAPDAQPDPGEDRTVLEVTGVVAADVTYMVVGVATVGRPTAWIEPPTLEVLDGTNWTTIAVANWGPGHEPGAAWMRFGEDDDLSASVGGSGCARGQRCLALRELVAPSEPPWRGHLAGGVAALVPLALDFDGAHTLPIATVATPSDPVATLLASDRATRLASVIIAWNIPQHFYPYFDVTGGDWPGELRIALGRAASDDGEEALWHTLRRLYGALHDGHGYVSHMDAPTSHVAPWTWSRVEGELVITRVAPACACDLLAGDVVTSIDGSTVEDVLAQAGEEASAATPQFLDYLVLSNLRVDGPRTMRLEVRRAAAMHAVDVPFLPAEQVNDALREVRPADGAEVAPGVRYFDLDGSSGERFTAALSALASADVVIFDLRGYPAGAIDLALAHTTATRVSTPQWHTPRVPRPDREHMSFTQDSWDVEPALPHLPRVIFLTDGRAVSAAETYLGIVEGHDLAEIVGGPTAGTNGNENPFTVPGGYWLWWTGLKVLKHDGSRHHGVGIQPTVPVAPTIAGVAAGRDEVLERAIEVAQAPERKAPKKGKAPRAKGKAKAKAAR